MRYPQEPFMSSSPTPNGHLRNTQTFSVPHTLTYVLAHTHEWTLTRGSEGCHVYPGVWLCRSTLQMSQPRKINVLTRKSAGSMCVLITPHPRPRVHTHTHMQAPCRICTHVCLCVSSFLEGGGEKNK